MPVFHGSPGRATMYKRKYIEIWTGAVEYAFEKIMSAIGLNPGTKITSAEDIEKTLESLRQMERIKPPPEFDNHNDFSMVKRHAYGDAGISVKAYLETKISEGQVPTLNDALLYVLAEPAVGVSEPPGPDEIRRFGKRIR